MDASLPAERAVIMTGVPVRVLVADDHHLTLTGLKTLIEREPGLQVVAEAQDIQLAARLAKELQPDVAILGLSNLGIGAAQIVQALRAECPVVVLAAQEERLYVRRLVQAGIAGYVLKRSPASDVIRAVEAVAQGGVYLDPVIAGLVISRGRKNSSKERDIAVAELSEREAEVLQLIAFGYSGKEVSARLTISPKTVETYKRRARQKLGIQTRVELVRYASNCGWLDDR
jgi:DNA-binding NarL/FixJ family response regulator